MSEGKQNKKMTDFFRNVLCGLCLLLLPLLACDSSRMQQEGDAERDKDLEGLIFSLGELKLKEGDSELNFSIKFYPRSGEEDSAPLRLELIPGPHVALGRPENPTVPSSWIKSYERIQHLHSVSIDESSEYKGLSFVLEGDQPLEIKISLKASERWGYMITKNIESYIELKSGPQNEDGDFVPSETRRLPLQIEAAETPPAHLLSRNGRQYRLAFEDEFLGTALDSEKWSVIHERQRRACIYKKENIKLADGFLEMILAANDIKTECTASMLVSKLVDFKWGYYEFRFRPQIQPGFNGQRSGCMALICLKLMF